MVQFHLGENSISFSDDFNKLNTLRTDIIDDMSQFSIYDSMEQLISKHGKMPNVDEVASSFPLMVNQLICEAIVPIIVNFLVENEIYDCSEELFIHRYQERYFNFAKQPQFQNFLSHYVDLANEYMEKRTQKAYNRANRSQWMGGGFGITGAIKGAAQAAVLNAATGVVRGIGDGISDFASSTAYKSKQNSLLSDDVFQEFDIALQNCIHGCILACQIEYSTHKGILCSWSQRENIEKSFAIFNNVQTRVTDTSKIVKLMSTAIELSPYNEEYTFYGNIKDGKADGIGLVYRDHKLVFGGEFKKGKPCGYGIVFDSDIPNVDYAYESGDCSTITMLVVHHRFVASGDGYIYYGFKTCRDTQTTGLELDDNAYIVYDGDLKENQKDGQGKRYFYGFDGKPIFLLYEGSYKDDECSGKGKSYYSNGQICYEGEYKKGKYNGKGTLYNEDGSVQYKGNFKDGNAA